MSLDDTRLLIVCWSSDYISALKWNAESESVELSNICTD